MQQSTLIINKDKKIEDYNKIIQLYFYINGLLKNNYRIMIFETNLTLVLVFWSSGGLHMDVK